MWSIDHLKPLLSFSFQCKNEFCVKYILHRAVYSVHILTLRDVRQCERNEEIWKRIAGHCSPPLSGDNPPCRCELWSVQFNEAHPIISHYIKTLNVTSPLRSFGRDEFMSLKCKLCTCKYCMYNWTSYNEVWL